MTSEQPAPVEAAPPTPQPPPIETTVKPVSVATTVSAISALQAIVGFLTAFLGVVQASSSVFGPEYMGIAMMLVGGTIAGLQSVSTWINSRASSKVQG